LIKIYPMRRLIECVPNFSEGRKPEVLEAIADSIKSVAGVQLLDVDPGKATNRTVFTFVGEPEPVIEAAFLAIQTAAKLIDMSQHSGEHPRMGATDVCPLVPISGITMEETVAFAHKLANRVGEELKIPVYCYESAALHPERKNLANIRAGEYEGLKEKLTKPEWKPDFGPEDFNPKSGATVIGARNFLVAYNVNLNTTSVRRANSVAYDVREKGRIKRQGDPISGEPLKDAAGEPIWEPGMLKSVKAIGWFIEEYGIAQISMNLTDISVCSVHKAFDAVCQSAQSRGMRVTGSELVGLIPLQSMLDAGKHYLRLQNRSTGLPERELVRIAVKSLGLDELKPFDANKKIIEYVMAAENPTGLVHKTVQDFVWETASESPAPGGGSISALAASMGCALATMVANLSAHKRGWDNRSSYFSDWAEKGQALADQLLFLVEEDTNSFNQIMEAFQLPKNSDAETLVRKQAIVRATLYAMEIPLKVMESCLIGFEICNEMAEHGMASSASDVGVGNLMLWAGLQGAHLNVKINAGTIGSEPQAHTILKRAEDVAAEGHLRFKEIQNRLKI
jgi:glutamate formiminotransferase / formiminotetrahydrofolate cyclodeaminase